MTTTRASTLHVSSDKSNANKLFTNDVNKLRTNCSDSKEESKVQSMPRADGPFVASSRSLKSSVLSFSPIR